MKKGKIATAFQGPEPGETFYRTDHTIGSFFCLFFKAWNKTAKIFRSSKEKNPQNRPIICHLLYPKTWWAELTRDQNIPKYYVHEAGSLVETDLKEDFVLFRESPKHGKAGIPSVGLCSMNWVTFNGSLSSDYLKSRVIMLLKSWLQQVHLSVFHHHPWV